MHGATIKIREMKCYITADIGLYDTVYIHKPPSEKHYQFSHIKNNKRKHILIKPTEELIFPNLFLSRNSTCFGQFLCPSLGVLHCTFGIGIYHQTCMTYTSAECTVENSR
jgi:hypothetical protein